MSTTPPRHVDEIARETGERCAHVAYDIAAACPRCIAAALRVERERGDNAEKWAATLEIALAMAQVRLELAERERDGLHALVVQARQERDEAEELRETSLRVAIDQKKRIAALTAELHGALYEIDVMLNDEHRPADGLKAWARHAQD